MTIDDSAYRIRAYQASRFVLTGGFDADPGNLFASFWLSYFLEVTSQSHGRLRIAAQTYRPAAYYPLYGQVDGREEPGHFSLDAGQILGTGFLFTGFTYYLELAPFLFAGPDVAVRTLDARNGLYATRLQHTEFAETGIRAFYQWDDYRFRLGAGRIFSFGSTFASWALQFSVAYSF